MYMSVCVCVCTPVWPDNPIPKGYLWPALSPLWLVHAWGEGCWVYGTLEGGRGCPRLRRASAMGQGPLEEPAPNPLSGGRPWPAARLWRRRLERCCHLVVQEVTREPLRRRGGLAPPGGQEWSMRLWFSAPSHWIPHSQGRDPVRMNSPVAKSLLFGIGPSSQGESGAAGFSSWAEHPVGNVRAGASLPQPGRGVGNGWLSVGVLPGPSLHPVGLAAPVAERDRWPG